MGFGLLLEFMLMHGMPLRKSQQKCMFLIEQCACTFIIIAHDLMTADTAVSQLSVCHILIATCHKAFRACDVVPIHFGDQFSIC